jgi:hypothetical protein
VHQQLNIADKDPHYMYSYNINEEIHSFRHIIRQRNFLPSHTLTTLSNTPLDSSFTEFSQHAKQNKDMHFQHIATHPLSSRKKYTPIFILESHRKKFEDIATKPKSEIIAVVESKLHSLQISTFDQRWIRIKKKKKTEILDFLKEISDITEIGLESD